METYSLRGICIQGRQVENIYMLSYVNRCQHKTVRNYILQYGTPENGITSNIWVYSIYLITLMSSGDDHHHLTLPAVLPQLFIFGVRSSFTLSCLPAISSTSLVFVCPNCDYFSYLVRFLAGNSQRYGTQSQHIFIFYV